MSPSIRLATPADAPALAQLNAEFNGSSDLPEQLAARMALVGELELATLAEVDDQLAGFACLRRVPCLLYATPYAELTELYVRPAFRRRGVARALLAHAEQLARAAGAAELHVATNPRNRAARACYRTAGFVLDDLALVKELAQ